MSMNRYGVKAQRHWARWLPRQYATISDPESFFTTLGEEEWYGDIGLLGEQIAHPQYA
jgi:hypothetical protein